MLQAVSVDTVSYQGQRRISKPHVPYTPSVADTSVRDSRDVWLTVNRKPHMHVCVARFADRRADASRAPKISASFFRLFRNMRILDID